MRYRWFGAVLVWSLLTAPVYAQSDPRGEQVPFIGDERAQVMRNAPFEGVAQTSSALQRLALDMQLFDYCQNPLLSEETLAPLLAEAARLTGDEPTCTAVMARLGYLQRSRTRR
ncbi:hypothetical protein [Hydrogenophilus thermoluteolus]|uniref:Uncharacterized protein n=1 Tax=Hydrogenophilus thermoluteolus TaxID=297 RepID=A0A2Z6DWU0_HYDTE|nr:hypothetical protein [Hydrogenophilus thermoluteolus]BBD76920.1 hypothetical protein HPTL_0652 [Hydrogenophilus thermoluteolus]